MPEVNEELIGRILDGFKREMDNLREDVLDPLRQNVKELNERSGKTEAAVVNLRHDLNAHINIHCRPIVRRKDIGAAGGMVGGLVVLAYWARDIFSFIAKVGSK